MKAEEMAKKHKIGLWRNKFDMTKTSKKDPSNENCDFFGKISEINGLNNFYIHKNFEKETLEKVESIINSIPKFFHLEQPIKYGMPCLALFPGDNKYYRGQVLHSLGNSEYSVFFFDYGNTETLNYKEICKMPEDLMKYEPLALKCSLAYLKCPSINHLELGEEAAEYFREITWDIEFKVKIIKVFDLNFLFFYIDI